MAGDATNPRPVWRICLAHLFGASVWRICLAHLFGAPHFRIWTKRLVSAALDCTNYWCSILFYQFTRNPGSYSIYPYSETNPTPIYICGRFTCVIRLVRFTVTWKHHVDPAGIHGRSSSSACREFANSTLFSTLEMLPKAEYAVPVGSQSKGDV